MFFRERAVTAQGRYCPVIQLGAENNIEKSRCLAQLRKKIFIVDAIRPGFSGFRASEARIRGITSCVGSL
jgi:hypothetical protein